MLETTSGIFRARILPWAITDSQSTRQDAVKSSIQASCSFALFTSLKKWNTKAFTWVELMILSEGVCAVSRYRPTQYTSTLRKVASLRDVDRSVRSRPL